MEGRFFVQLRLLLLTAAFVFSNIPGQAAQRRPPGQNVLLVTLDTIRPDRLSCYGSGFLITPNIDSLASRGALFERAFAHNPITLPSHANILLGTTPLNHGVHDNSRFRVDDTFLTLAEFMKSQGYATGAFIGAFALDARFGLSQGFDVYDQSFPSGPDRSTVSLERRAEDVIDSALSWLKGRPAKWFAWVHIWDPHSPYLPPEPFLSRFKSDPYSGEVAYVDAELGRLSDYLESEGMTESTFIILTGDHGESLGEHGELTHTYFAYNSTLWIPLVLAGPGIEASRIGDNVSHIDIFPTVCDLLQIEKPPSLQGASLLPLVGGKKSEKRPIYFESLAPFYNQGWAPLRGHIEGAEKFIDSPLPEFYNLEHDFNEQVNLAGNTDLNRYLKRQKELEEELSSIRQGQGDQKIDRQAQDKLRSLGYIVSSSIRQKESYGPEDDLKTLLPYQQKLDRAVIHFDEGQREKGIALLDELLKERTDLVPGFIYLSDIYKSQGQMEKASAILELGLKHNPDDYALLSTCGLLSVREGNWERGIEALEKALSYQDFDHELWNHLGYATWRKGDAQKALEYYGRALSLDGKDPFVLYNIGSLYLARFMNSKNRQDHFQAMESFKKAIETDPGYVLAYQGLGIGYRMQGLIREAISVWETALEMNPEDDFLVYSLGEAYFELGNKGQALSHFEKLLLLKKDSMTAEERSRIEKLILECKKEPETIFFRVL